MPFELTPKQAEANQLLASPARHCMLFGGSRSGKTFLICRAIASRAIRAPGARHAILRFRSAHVRASIVNDTWPKMMRLCYPDAKWRLDKQELVVRFEGLQEGSEVYFGGLDDKERTEKILGMEFAGIFLNECSQIPWGSREVAVTRLAQVVHRQYADAPPAPLKLKMYYDENPPDKGHWTYRLFKLGINPETKEPLRNRDDFRCLQINPRDNLANLPEDYIGTLEGLSARMRRRFLEGEFRDSRPDALFTEETFDRYREIDQSDLPDMQRIIIGVDPSGSGDTENSENDAIGICVVGLGTNGLAYVLEDLTVKAGPKTWGNIVASAYDRHQADLVVGEGNFGGAMVGHVIQTARPRTPFKIVTASRGKVVRAEPISALCEQGKVRMVGNFPALEEELCGFTTAGYTGSESPNRADAFVWAAAELFPGMVSAKKEQAPAKRVMPGLPASVRHAWMG
jgi:PBSX family phage terminase large subunit